MKAKLLLTTILLFSLIPIGFSQTATIKGVILNENNQPIEKVSVKTKNGGTESNANGFYSLTINANQEVSVEFTHLSHKKLQVHLT